MAYMVTVSMIKHLADDIGKRVEKAIKEAETMLAMDLARPSWTVGILAMTFRPANNHPYHQGTEITIKYCATLCSMFEGLLQNRVVRNFEL